MSAVIAGVMVFTTFLVVSGVAFFNLHDTWSGPTAALQEAADLRAERVQTLVSIGSAGPTEVDCKSFTIDVDNPGQTSVSDFSEMDLIAVYPGTNGLDITTYLQYVDATPAPNQWTLTGIAPDTLDPNTWNPEETATFAFQITAGMDHPASGLLTVGTPLAVTDSTYFNCDLIHYLHTETTDIAGTAHYKLKNKPADGVAATITATFAPEQVARVRPAANNGKFVFSLPSFADIPGSTWTVTYRVRKDQPDLGFVWFDKAKKISLKNKKDRWFDIDLVPHDVPTIATGAIVEVYNQKANAHRGMLRGTQDSRDYMAGANDGNIEGKNHRWQVVKIDDNREIQGYITDKEVNFRLLGYTIGTDPVYFDTPPDVTPGTTGAWTPVDVSANVAADADGVILLIRSIDGADRNYAIREVGSSYNTTNLKLGKYANTMYLVGLSASKEFDAWVENANIEIYLVAQTKGSVVYYINDIAVGDPPQFNKWRELDADDYAVDPSANGLIFLLEVPGNQDRKVAVRHGDSKDNWEKRLDSNIHLQGAAGLNDANRWDIFIEDTDVETFIAAYTRLVRMDVHADLDVVVRQADGDIRDTLATNVANTIDITSTTWETLTGTYVFSTYTVVDETDYLEIDLFAEATSNTSTQNVAVDFRVDDPTLAKIDQAKVEF